MAVAGASNANDTTKGIVEIATASEAAASTNLGGTGARLVLGANLATATPYTTGNFVVMTDATGKINPGFMATSSLWTFTGGVTINRSTTTNATTTTLQVSSIASTSQLITGSLGVGVATTTASSSEIGGNQQVRGLCLGCTAIATSSAAASLPTTNSNAASATASCPGESKVIGGGFALTSASDQQVFTGSASGFVISENWAINTQSWKVTVVCDTGSTCQAGTLRATAMCVVGGKYYQ